MQIANEYEYLGDTVLEDIEVRSEDQITHYILTATKFFVLIQNGKKKSESEWNWQR